MSSNSFLNQNTISKVKRIHKGFLWVAAGVLIASLLLGVILIFVDSKSDMFGKIQGTFGILALAAFICINNFIRIEKGNKVVQGFALTGVLANMVWLVLGILMIWGALSPVEVVTTTTRNRSGGATTRTYDYDYDYDYYNDYYSNYEMDDVYRNVAHPTSYNTTTLNITVAARIVIVAAGLASIGFWVSNVLAIKDRVKSVKPLKIAAVACELFASVSVIILALAWPIEFDQNTLKWVQLSGLATSGFVVMALAAWIISITHKNFDSAPAIVSMEKVSSDIEIKASDEKPLVVEKESPVIEVKTSMTEKKPLVTKDEPLVSERESLEIEEKSEKVEKKEVLPFQDENMPPVVSHHKSIEIIDNSESSEQGLESDGFSDSNLN